MAHALDPVGQASELVQQGRLPEARESLRQLLAAAPAHAQALHLAGMVEMLAGAPRDAIPLLERCVEAAPQAPFAWSNLGVAFDACGDSTNALACFRKALNLEPRNPTTMKNQGIALRRLGRFEEAMASLRRAAERAPNDPDIFREVGDLLVEMGRPAEALARYDRALAANPRDAVAHHNRGFAAWRAGQHERAREDVRRALALSPGFARAHATLGAVEASLGLFAESAQSCARAVELEPGEARWHDTLGMALFKLGRHDEAIASFDRALSIDPAFAIAIEDRAAALRAAGRREEALAEHERAFGLDANLPCNPGYRLELKLAFCEWEGCDALVAHIASRLEEGFPASQPFPLLHVAVPASLHRRCSELYAREYPAMPPPAPRDRAGDSRIRVGYFSAEFHDHPVGFLLAPLLEHHDRARFEVIAYSYGPDRADATRARIEAACDRFEQVAALSEGAIANLARTHGIDIAIDLMGYTGDGRPGIFARRAAPIQAQYLGFPGTMGSSSHDYLIADEVVVPEAHRDRFSERIVELPGTYQVNDAFRRVAPRRPTRAELGLPGAGLVLCSFNDPYKISPHAFETWMRVLLAAADSVLWLVEGSQRTVANLRSEASRHGVDPARLAFAPRVPIAEHLARVSVADLALDTFPYNGHATTSDTLLAGVPVVTWLGEAFAGRVSASLLGAVGLDALVARSPEEYGRIAAELARDRAALAGMRARLAANRSTHPLFDTARFARNFERALAAMMARQAAGLAPDHVRLDEQPRATA